jgi:WD40 repeat protein
MNLENNEINLLGTLTGHQNPIFALAVSSINPDTLYTAGNDKGVVEWDLKSMSFKRLLCKVGSSVYSLLSIPETSLLAIGMRSGQLLVVDTNTQTLKQLAACWAS